MKKFASVFVFLFTFCVIFSALGCSNSAGGGGSSGGGQNTSGTTVTITINSNPTNITYNLNGGTGGSGEFNICTDNNRTLNNSITKEGYTFGGWYTTPDFSTSPITKITEDTTLYAKWEPKTISLTLNFDGGNGSPTTISGKYGAAVTAPANPTKTGYNFTGWAKSQTGSAEYKDKQSVANLASTNNATVTLYAVWVVEGSYSITYNLDGGTNAAANPAGYNAETATFTLAAPTKEGYNFEGWYSDSTYTTSITQIAKGTNTGNITLYAKWEAKTITLTLNLDGGSGSPATLSGKYGTAVTAPTDPTKSGYEFTGWTPPLPATFTADATYTAQWNAVATEINGLLNKDNADEILTPLNGADWRTKENIVIPNGVTSIDSGVFNTRINSWVDDTKPNTILKTVTIPSSVASIIPADTFLYCNSLEKINVDQANANYCSQDGILFNKDKTKLIRYPSAKQETSYTIPSSVTSISANAFNRCTLLTSVTIQEGVTSIGFCAFELCTSLKSVTIPESVIGIGEYAFSNCYKLSKAIFLDKNDWATYERILKKYRKKFDITITDDTFSNAEKLIAPLDSNAWCCWNLLKGGIPAVDPIH